jgi:hypothetical protein|nr:MAG TPA: hypothetical protein [Siphoviridae sp. ct7JV2]
MIRVVTNANYGGINDLTKAYLEIARQSLKDYVEKSALNRNEAISTHLKDGARACNEIDGFPKSYVVGHCAVGLIYGSVFLVDYMNIDLDQPNEIEFIRV